MMQFAFELIKCHSHLMVLYSDQSSGDRMYTRGHNPQRLEFNMFRPTKSKIEKSISYTMRNAWNSLPLIAHEKEDRKMLSNYLLVNSKYLAFL